MNNYKNYQLEDFLNDEDFHDWVYSQTPIEDTVWAKVLSAYPQKNDALYQAKSIILNWKTETSSLSEDQRRKDIKTIMSAVDNSHSERGRWFRFTLWSWQAAAAALIFIFAGWGIWQKQSAQKEFSYEVLVQQAAYPLNEIVNDKQSPMQINLPDASVITLSPGSKISYSGSLHLDSTRNVILTGDAYFKVKRDSRHPFLVLSNGITTRVLGTSFRVNSTSERVSVEVTSGSVSVSRMQPKYTDGKENLLLLPNQQAVFSADENVLKKSLVENPVLVDQLAESQTFKFDETPVTKVFDVLEKSYGIRIEYDKEALKDCNITIPLLKESFYAKLDIICNTIKADYRIDDNKVIISGKGCN